jgi:hypothetical protein
MLGDSRVTRAAPLPVSREMNLADGVSTYAHDTLPDIYAERQRS